MWEDWIHGWVLKCLVKCCRAALWAALGITFIELEEVTTVENRDELFLSRTHWMTFFRRPSRRSCSLRAV